MKQKKVLLPIVMFVMSSGLFLNAPMVNAAGFGDLFKGTFLSGLVSMIAQKFNLDPVAVQSAVTNYQQINHPNIPNGAGKPNGQIRWASGSGQINFQQMEDNRLSKLVTDGKITADQKTAIEAELASLQTKYNLGNMSGQTPDQRKQNMQNFQNDLKTWAASQGIDITLIQPFGMGGPRGMGGRGRGKPPTN